MSAPVRVGLVGCGRLAERGYLPALARTTSTSLVAVADLDPGRCEAVAPGVPAYTSTADLLAAADVELVVLAHAAAAHVTDAELAVSAGAGVLVEKPPARTAAAAAPLLDLAPRCWMGLNRRFEPAVAELRAALDSAPPATLELEMSILPASWDAVAGSEDALLDLGPHLVDLALWLAGPARAVRVLVLDEGEAAFEIDHGHTRSTVRVSHRRGWRESVVARDGAGDTIARLERGGFVGRAAGTLRRRGESPLVASLAAQLEAAATAARGAAADPRLATAAEGLALMRVLDAVRAASRPATGVSS
jgi:predicted dehydrogenase